MFLFNGSNLDNFSNLSSSTFKKWTELILNFDEMAQIKSSQFKVSIFTLNTDIRFYRLIEAYIKRFRIERFQKIF